MGQERMTELALMHMDDISNIFAGQHQCRMLFADIS